MKCFYINCLLLGAVEIGNIVKGSPLIPEFTEGKIQDLDGMQLTS